MPYCQRLMRSVIFPSRVHMQQLWTACKSSSLPLQNCEVPQLQPTCKMFFLEHNVSPDIHKALAIHVLSQAIVQHGMGIMGASKLSASVTGFSEKVIWKWAKEYYFTALLFYMDELEDDLSI